MVIYNQTGATLSRGIGPDPLQEDARAQTGLRQKLQVDCGPCEPREEAADVDLAALQNGEPLADYRHIALVEVTKRPRGRFTGDNPMNQGSRIAPLLNRHLRDNRQRFTILIQRGSIADDKDFRMPSDSEVWLDAYPPGAICTNVQPFASG